MGEILWWFAMRVVNMVISFLLKLAWRKVTEWWGRWRADRRAEKDDDTPAG